MPDAYFTTGRVRMPDHRLLGYSETGSRRGKPVFYFHGFPGSRLEIKFLEKTARDLNLRVIGVDRPGYGLSDFKTHRRIADWPGDVTALADALGLDSFSVFGISGGGPYAAACALKIPHRLVSVGIVCGLGPHNAPGATRGMRRINRFGLRLAEKKPFLSNLLLKLAPFGLRWFSGPFIRHATSACRVSAATVASRSFLVRIMKNSFREAVRSGSAGLARDLFLYARPWEIRFRDIRAEVHLWHGEKDTVVPPSMGRYLASRIPDCVSGFYPDEGHFSLVFNRQRDILSALVRIVV